MAGAGPDTGETPHRRRAHDRTLHHHPGKQEAQRGTKKPSEPEESAVAVLTGSVAGDMLQRESQLAEFLSQLEHSPMVLSLVVEKQQTDTEILSFVATLRLV